MSALRPDVQIVVLNYRGADLLPLCLPSIVEASQKSSFPTTVAVLDNPGPENGLDYVTENFPSVHIERAKKNRILCSYNDYLPKVRQSVVIFLNNDIRVEPDFVDPLIEKFVQDPLTFLVAPMTKTFDGNNIEAARSKAGMRFGLFWCDARYPGYEKEAEIPSETFSSGFGAFSREKFLALGGYDERYLPGIMEDVDLCLRAKKAGYHLYYEPRSVVYHMGQASFKKEFGTQRTAVIAHRNNFLFMWKNFSGPAFWLPHLFFLPLRLLLALFRGQWVLGRGFFNALQIQMKKVSK